MYIINNQYGTKKKLNENRWKQKRKSLNGYTGIENYTHFGTVALPFEVYYYPEFKINDKSMRLWRDPEKNVNVYYLTVQCTRLKMTFKKYSSYIKNIDKEVFCKSFN